jgi:transposase
VRHLLRRINPTVTRILAEFREKLEPFYSEIGRPSIDPELMIRMLIVGYCYGIRFERKLCEEVELHLAYRWFCRLDLDDKVPDHSTFSVNRHGRFRDSDLFRQVFEAVVRACMDAGLVKGEAFAVDASVMEADASRYHGKAPDEIDWSVPELRRGRSPNSSGPLTTKIQRRSQAAEGDLSGGPVLGLDRQGQQALDHHFGRGGAGPRGLHVNDDCVLDVDQVVEPVAELNAVGLQSKGLFGTACGRYPYGTGKFLGWLVGTGITPQIPVWDKSETLP